jgi:hypothetical protein
MNTTELTNKLIANKFSFLGVVDDGELDYFEEISYYKIGIISAENMIIILINKMGWGIDGDDQDWDIAKNLLKE